MDPSACTQTIIATQQLDIFTARVQINCRIPLMQLLLALRLTDVHGNP